MAVVRLGTSTRNAAATAVAAQIDAGAAAGTLQIRSGTMPATPQTAATGTLLATVTFSDPAGGAPATGVVTLTDPAQVTGVGDATATWARFLDSNAVAVMDVDVTVTGGGGYIQLSTTTISTGVTVDMAAITITMPQG